MATDLYAISNFVIPKEITFKFLDEKIKELEDLNLSVSSSLRIGEGGREYYEKDTQLWYYEVDNEKGYLNIYFNGGYCYSITILPNIAFVSTIYRYRLLYDKVDWFQQFREDLYNIIKVFGGSEIIYLADNCCDKLGTYFECMVLENTPYKVVKEEMIAELGQPVTDYRKLDYNKLSYSNITEFVLDDFKNIFRKPLLEIGAEGGGFTIYKDKDEQNNTFYSHQTIEMHYDLNEEINLKKGKPRRFTSFSEAFIHLKSKYKSLFIFFPLFMSKEVKLDISNFLELEFKNLEKDKHYKMWNECLNDEGFF